MKLILKAFLHRFWDDFRGPGNVKNEQKRGRVALFLIFGVCKIRCRFGAVLGGSWKGFWEHFGACELDFRFLKRSQISKPKLEAEKVVLGTREGSRGQGLAALLLIVDQSIIDNIHRRSLTSFIAGH